MLWLYARTGTFDLPTLAALAAQHAISPNSAALWLASLAFLFAFAVKVPVFPLHGWLAGAIEEAPTAAVMVLAGKTGLYSILRFSFGIFPAESHRIAPLMIALGAIGIVYGALIALVQNDLKRLAAFGTLGHLSFITLGIFTFTIAGLDGGIYQILNESLAGAALFMLMGLLYERYGTYDMRQYGGLAAKLPWVVTMFVITALSVIGLPMLNSFVGEFLILTGSMQFALGASIPLDRPRHHRRHLQRGLHAHHDPARLLLRRSAPSPRPSPRQTSTPASTSPSGPWPRFSSSWVSARPSGCKAIDAFTVTMAAPTARTMARVPHRITVYP